MDHDEAVRLQAAVKYVLGELPQAERDSFEEHYFDCRECALDVKAAAALADNGRQVLRAEAVEVAAGRKAESKSGWLFWLRPAFAAPALLILLVVIGYQNLVSLPHWKSQATQSAASRVLPMFSLITANTRGAGDLIFRVRQGEPFGLYVDVPADAAYRAYLLRLEDSAGHSKILRTLSYEEVQKTQIVEVNPDSRSGAYQLVTLGLGPGSDPAKGIILATMKFNVEFVK